jgi:hypothetical protein
VDIVVGSDDYKVYRFEATRPHGRIIWAKFRGSNNNTGSYLDALNHTLEHFFDW